MQNPFINFLLFVVIVAVLYAIWALYGNELGHWLIPIALAVASIPQIVMWFLRSKDAVSEPSESAPPTWRRPAALDPKGHPIMFAAFVFIAFTFVGKFLGWF